MITAVLKKCVLFAIIFFIPLITRSQDQITIPKIQGEFKFDGTVDDACWQNINATYNGNAYPNIWESAN